MFRIEARLDQHAQLACQPDLDGAGAESGGRCCPSSPTAPPGRIEPRPGAAASSRRRTATGKSRAAGRTPLHSHRLHFAAITALATLPTPHACAPAYPYGAPGRAGSQDAVYGTLTTNRLSSNGSQCLNWLSHLRGQAQSVQRLPTRSNCADDAARRATTSLQHSRLAERLSRGSLGQCTTTTARWRLAGATRSRPTIPTRTCSAQAAKRSMTMRPSC